MIRSSRYLEEKMQRDNNYCRMQVVFVDIVAYSRRASYAQARVIHAFMDTVEEAITNTARECVAYTNKIDAHVRNDSIVLPAGDGAAIAFPFDGMPDLHLRFIGKLMAEIDTWNGGACEAFLQQGWCDCCSAFRVRCGAALGMLILYKDLNENFNVAGEAINMARRVMDLADPGQVFFTRAAYEELTQLVPGTRSLFQEYRQVLIKHGHRVDVYQLVDRSLRGLDVSHVPRLDAADVRPTDDVAGLPVEHAASPAGRSTGVAAIHHQRDRTPPPELEEHPTDGLTLVGVPAGTFIMGGERTGRMEAEVPNPLFVATHPVTQEVYARIVRARPPCGFTGDRLPVDSVSWIDAVMFCNALSEVAGLEPAYEVTDGKDAAIRATDGYRLPTEAEWEYCCRAGTVGDRYAAIDDIAWYNGNALGRTHEVATKHPNSWGLYDMLGNVWEWCDRAPGLGTDAAGPVKRARAADLERPLRGGSWSDVPECITATYRHRQNMIVRMNTHGFRVARNR